MAKKEETTLPDKKVVGLEEYIKVLTKALVPYKMLDIGAKTMFSYQGEDHPIGQYERIFGRTFKADYHALKTKLKDAKAELKARKTEGVK
jgi:hypothetical protein